MSKSKIFLAVIVGFITLSLVLSCSKDENNSNKSLNTELRYSDGDGNDCNSTVSIARIEFGGLLYKALLNDAVFANYIKQKMVTEFNTKYSFLYIQERNKVVHSGKTVENILIQHSGLSNLQAKAKIDEIVCGDPLITISMSDQDNVNVTNWNSDLPGIAAVKECDSIKYILFNSSYPNGSGEITTDPTVPTINIISSEIYYLVKSNGMTSKGTKIDNYMPTGPTISSILDCSNFINLSNSLTENSYSICGNSYTLFEHDALLQMYIDCFNLNTPSYNPPTFPPSAGCPRDMETLDETLIDFKIKNYQVYKNFANKFWENKFVCHGNILAARNYSNGSAIPHAAKYVSQTLKRGDLLNCSGVCTGKFITSNYRIWTDWDQAEFGSPYYIDWYEEDGGTQTVGISFPLTAKFKIKGQEIGAGVTPSFAQTSSASVPLGNSFVNYCDPIMRENDTGSIVFRCN